MESGRRIGKRIDSDRQQLDRVATVDLRQAFLNRAEQRTLEGTNRSAARVNSLNCCDALEKEAAE